MKNLILQPHIRSKIDARVDKILRDLGNPSPPLRLEDVRELLRLDLGYYQSSNDGIVRETIHCLTMAGKQLLARPALLFDALRKFSIKALYVPDRKRILIDETLPQHPCQHALASRRDGRRRASLTRCDAVPSKPAAPLLPVTRTSSLVPCTKTSFLRVGFNRRLPHVDRKSRFACTLRTRIAEPGKPAARHFRLESAGVNALFASRNGPSLHHHARHRHEKFEPYGADFNELAIGFPKFDLDVTAPDAKFSDYSRGQTVDLNNL
jgi:hypothetical protein